jgi:hypothetical protein
MEALTFFKKNKQENGQKNAVVGKDGKGMMAYPMDEKFHREERKKKGKNKTIAKHVRMDGR